MLYPTQLQDNNNNSIHQLQTINFENMDYSNHKMKINSPRSLKILEMNGIKMQELYYYNFFEYREMHPEIIPLSLEIQKNHFYHEQGMRAATLSNLVSDRRKMIDEENKLLQQKQIEMQKPKDDLSLSIANNSTISSKTKTKIRNEVERCREKNKKELMNMLENNLRAAFIQQQNDLKAKLDADRRRDKEVEMERIRAERDRYNQWREEQKRIKAAEEEENRKKAYQQYFEDEKKRRIEEERKQKENEAQKRKRETERMKKEEEFKMRLQSQKDALERQRADQELKMMKQDMRRVNKMNERRMREEEIQRKKKEFHDQTMQKTMAKNQKLMDEKKSRILEKQERIDEQRMRKKLDDERMEKSRLEEVKKKEKRRQEILERNVVIQELKNNEIEEKKARREIAQQSQYQIKKNVEQERQQQRIQNEKRKEEVRQLNEYYKNQRENEILQRINERDEKTKKEMQDKEKAQRKQRQINDLKAIEAENNKTRRKQIDEYEIELKRREIEEKKQMIEKKQKEKEEDQLKKKTNLRNAERQKEEIKKIFEEALRKNRSTIDVEKVKKMFPNDKKFHEKLDKIKEDYETFKEKEIEKYNSEKMNLQIQARAKSAGKMKRKKTDNNIEAPEKTPQNPRYKDDQEKDSKEQSAIKSKKKRNEIILPDYKPIKEEEKISETKMKVLIENYRNVLLKDYVKFFDQEKKKNQERDQKFKEAETEADKKRLMKIFSLQRGQSKDKIGEYNRLIDEKLKEYENELKKHLIK